MTDPSAAPLANRAAARVDAVVGLAWESTDPVALELCRLAIAEIVGNRRAGEARTPAATEAGLTEDQVRALENWPAAPEISARQRACLAFAEQFATDVSRLESRQVEALEAHMSPEEVFRFVTALALVDEQLRLTAVLESALTEEVAR